MEDIYEGRFSDSLATIRKGTCLAGTLGRVCVRPCESNWRRANIDEPVAIKHLKRVAADYEIEKNIGPVPVLSQDETAAPVAKKVAIVAQVPAGLSCAYYLVQCYT